MPELFDNNQGAEFSPCGKYWYKLWRIWDPALPKAMCIGLNPSTANAEDNDPTIRNLIQMLTTLGYGGFYMTNLFAIVSSDPDVLLSEEIDLQLNNEEKLKQVSAICQDVIVCWGMFPQAKKRIPEVLPQYPHAKCFGWNKDGTPWHPMGMTYKKGALKNPQLSKYI